MGEGEGLGEGLGEGGGEVVWGGPGAGRAGEPERPGDRPADRETAGAAPGPRHAELRLWLRLLTLTTLVEGEVRGRLREGFAVTLPRFDLMAQLARAPEGLTLSALSRRLMVSNGNVTGVVERLVEGGLVERRAVPGDRRRQAVRLTPEGRRAFAAMARAHEGWMEGLFAGLSAAEVEALMRLLGRAKASVRAAVDAPREDAA